MVIIETKSCLYYFIIKLIFYTRKSGAKLEPVDRRADEGAINTMSIPAAPGEGCPRCGGKVFNAEEKLSKNKVSFQIFIKVFFEILLSYFYGFNL